MCFSKNWYYTDHFTTANILYHSLISTKKMLSQVSNLLNILKFDVFFKENLRWDISPEVIKHLLPSPDKDVFGVFELWPQQLLSLWKIQDMLELTPDYLGLKTLLCKMGLYSKFCFQANPDFVPHGLRTHDNKKNHQPSILILFLKDYRYLFHFLCSVKVLIK